MKSLLKNFSAFAFSVAALLMTSSAFADCGDMGSSEWNELSTSMAQAYDRGQLNEALDYGKRLMLICNRSPIVNYTISEIYRRMDNELESYNYVKRATENIADYPVPFVLAEKMWMRRAETDLPYKSQAEQLQAKLDEMKADQSNYAYIKSQYDELMIQKREEDIRNEYLLEKTKGNWAGALWSGVGIMGAGVVLTITGGVLVSNSKKVESSGSPSAEKSGFAVSKKYVAGWTLLGAGIVATIGGTVLTGIAGYRYNNLDINGDGKKNETMSFTIMPTAAFFDMTF